MAKKKPKTKMKPTTIVADEKWKKTKPPTDEKKAHHPFEQWMVDILIMALENKDVLSDWEKSFVRDRAGAFDKFGWNAVITDKQIESLKSLGSKLKVKTLMKGF